MTNPSLAAQVPHIYYPVAVPATGTSGPFALSGDVLIGGWSFVESTGAGSAAFDLVDGGDVNGGLLAAITLDPGQSIRDILPGKGVILRTGLFIKILSGAIRGSIWVADV